MVRTFILIQTTLLGKAQSALFTNCTRSNCGSF